MNLITANDVARIEAYRAKVFGHIKAQLAKCGHCKSYEGAVNICPPNYFEQGDPEGWRLELHCYLIGPSRHYEWRGGSLAECLTKAEADLGRWLADDYESTDEEPLMSDDPYED